MFSGIDVLHGWTENLWIEGISNNKLIEQVVHWSLVKPMNFFPVLLSFMTVWDF